MARIDPLALATKGIKAKGSRTDPLGLATRGILVTGGTIPPIPSIGGAWRMWTGSIAIDVYGRYDRG